MWLTNAPVENVDWVPVPSNNGILQKNIDSGQIQSDASRRAESQGGFEIWAHRQQCFTSMHLQAVCQFVAKQVQGFILMRTNVVIDDDLMESALKLSGLKTKKDAIEEGLKLLVLVKSQEAIRAFRGKLKWSGNLDKMRLDK